MASDARPSKRSRQTVVVASTSTSTSTAPPPQAKAPAPVGRLFAPFRSLGHVSTSVPLVVLSRSSKYLETPALTVLTSLGNSWAMWEGQGLKVLFVGPDMGSPITSLALSLDSVYASTSKGWVGRFVRGKQVAHFVMNGHAREHRRKIRRGKAASSSSSSSSGTSSEDDVSDTSDDSDLDSDSDGGDDEPASKNDPSVAEGESLHSLCIFGTTMLALTASGTKMIVWDLPALTKEASQDPLAPPSADDKDETASVMNESGHITPYATIEFPTGFTATKVVHPASYLNKVVVGSQEGELAVWNVRTANLVHTFSAAALAPLSSPSPITALTQSPAIDVLGVGLANGACILFDVRIGQVLGKVKLEGEGAGEVVGVAFRNDDISHTLAVSSSTGHIALFDLAAKMRLLHLVRAAHEGAVGGLVWVTGQPLMMTSGGDNSIKQWLFDSPSAPPRLLKQRSGHHAPPHLVRYYGEDGKAILTAGADHALRYTSIVRDSRGYELSQGSIARKATHLGVKPSSLKLPLITSLAYSTARAKEWDDVVTVSRGEEVGRSWSVLNKRVGKWTLSVQGSVKCSAVTACGNFGLVGSSMGQVVLYNLQSGLKRKVFKVPHNGSTDVRGQHVTGVATDALNRIVVASTLKGALHFFDFQTMRFLKTVALGVSITRIVLQRENGLLVAVCDDLVLRIVDIETKRVVRELAGPRGQILDVAWSADSRWLIATSQDSIIRTYDIPTGNLIDAFRTSTVATSLSFSPTNDFLATTHVGSVGVYLWANRAQLSEVALGLFDEDKLGVEEVGLPSLQGVAEDENLSELMAPTNWSDLPPFTTPDQLSGELLTLSLMPRSRWQTLLNLDTIKQRNKPKEKPKAPERAPFFLPTLSGVKNRFDLGADGKENAKDDDQLQKKKTKLDFVSAMSVETEFMRRLSGDDPTGNYESFFTYLKALSPSSTDLEIRSLTLLPHLSLFLSALNRRLASHRDFEAVQAYLSLFLRIHGDVVVQNTELLEPLLRIDAMLKQEADRLVERTARALGTLAFLRSAPVV
ncbi:BZ3500_MvSof-1268-A1-R1_Chr8-2g10291 [Microbotryum saponariae]|uniref:BZ3500_MvSof-1268-A1-R1_Chr8-2g10291 protein n=1 Tax=Microbotryum saponariae TaxID=289078 RepID=A0A2X0L636_9BASI|nr:BZ3500_MvSof-1268-A1-R1_Chr8-2g10291 [Microbotryum saponariae]SDA02114.1 BZ3501_MvSof-1269-A2-R1_Chr8-2g10041 [Microbotryum saponariae]